MARRVSETRRTPKAFHKSLEQADMLAFRQLEVASL